VTVIFGNERSCRLVLGEGVQVLLEARQSFKAVLQYQGSIALSWKVCACDNGMIWVGNCPMCGMARDSCCYFDMDEWGEKNKMRFDD
jgi:hypothetical protein